MVSRRDFLKRASAFLATVPFVIKGYKGGCSAEPPREAEYELSWDFAKGEDKDTVIIHTDEIVFERDEPQEIWTVIDAEDTRLLGKDVIIGEDGYFYPVAHHAMGTWDDGGIH